MTRSKPVCIGKIVGSHGVHGRLKIKTYTEKPESIVQYGEVHDHEGRKFVMEITSIRREMAIVQLQGVTRKEQADELIGRELFIDRSQLPETEGRRFYLDDLVGMEVVSATGKRAGEVTACHNYGAGDIIEIAFDNGSSDLFPFDRETFPDVNLEGGQLVFSPPEIIMVKPE